MQGSLEQTLIYLAAAVIAVPIAKRLGLGSVLGFLVAGIVIGPWGLGLIGEVETVLHFAEFGVVLLLFLVGLELKPKKLMELRWPIFGAGSAQVTGTIAAVILIGVALGAPLTVVIVAGMGFAMSSTAIALATLAERGLLATGGGRLSFAVLLFQDLAVIPLMLALALLQPGEHARMDALSIAKAIAIIALVVVGGRYLLRPILRYIAGTGMREIFIAFALLLIVGIALAMQSVGLSMALGTFLAGVLLADSEYRHELELDIEPFKGLLLGLFFIAVGMSVDLGLFLRAPLLVIGLALGIVALKIALLLGLARAFRVRGIDAIVFALYLSQVGEFAFVLFGAAATQGVLPRETIDVLNAATAASMLTTPLLVFAFERWIAPRLNREQARAADVIDERNPVIIAGFGRFGQVVTRLLHGLGIGTTVVDHDPNQIELVRRFGYRAYYGDATRIDLLESAGAEHAKLLIVAVDDAGAARQIVALARERFPSLQILARARSRTDAFDFHAKDVPFVRETFRASLEAGEMALKSLGYGAYAARRAAEHFGRHDEAMLAQAAAHRGDIKKLIALIQQGREDLNELMANEALRSDAKAVDAWHGDDAYMHARRVDRVAAES
jgi:glutathione-regulated potassium-efflux system protein KefB